MQLLFFSLVTICCDQFFILSTENDYEQTVLKPDPKRITKQEEFQNKNYNILLFRLDINCFKQSSILNKCIK